jgi:SAM-dependent methyltransferase
MKLNLGCNKHALEGYVNVDVVPHRGVGVIADAHHLPFSRVDAVYAGHLIEHLAYPIDFLLECWRALEPGGELSVVIPDVTRMTAHVVGALFGFWLDDSGEPAPRNVECLHKSWWSLGTLIAITEACGFEFVDSIDRWDDPRLVVGADGQSGANFVKVGQDPTIGKAAGIYHTIEAHSEVV